MYSVDLITSYDTCFSYGIHPSGNRPGWVDNLNRDLDGRYWVGFVTERSLSWDEMPGGTFLRTILLRYSRPPEVSIPENGTARCLHLTTQAQSGPFP